VRFVLLLVDVVAVANVAGLAQLLLLLLGG